MTPFGPVRVPGSNARARFAAPGRWSRLRAGWGLWAVLLAAACAPVGSGGEADGPAGSGGIIPAPEAPADDEARAEALQAEAASLAAEGRDGAALARLLALPPEVVDEAALELARASAGRLTGDELERALADAPVPHPVTAAGLVVRATGLLLSGEPQAAQDRARSALNAGAEPMDAQGARSILDGRLPPGMEPLRLGALLPLSGSPALRSFASGVRDGMEAALTAAGLEGVVELEILDTGGDGATAAALVRSAESTGVLGVVGPLQDDALAAAAAARSGDLTLLSPTAYTLPPGTPGGVYSLGTTDPGAARSLASWAVGAGLRQVAVLHASRGTSAEEAQLFEEAFQAEGGTVVRRLVYEPGATYFQEQLRAVHELRPQALVLPVPPEDVQALAPQVSFFGLDTLGIQILGTAGWTDPEILSQVSRRHLDGVVVATPRRPDRTSQAYRRFVDAYESHFRRSLVDGGVPALGYDAASLYLEAVRSGARTSGAVRQTLEGVQDFAGATGSLSVLDGRVVRAHQVVCLWGGAGLSLGPGQRPGPAFRPYVPDPETGEVPEGPGRPSGFTCPGAEPPPPGN